MRRSLRIMIVLAILFSMLAVVGPPAGATAQRVIAGKISRLGEPVVGVGVGLLDVATGVWRTTCTDADGKYRFPKVTVGAEFQLATGRWLVPPDPVEGTAPCTNWDFKAPSGKPWLNYRHPNTHGEWRPKNPVTFVLPAGRGAYRANMKLQAATRVCVTYRATIWGTNGPDVIEGTPRHDVIMGRGGKDLIAGKGGYDLICGGGANDTLKGGNGSDVLFGDAGNGDRLLGGPAPDVCYDPAYKKAECEVVLP